MLPDLANPEIWAALFTLTILEVILGIDNVIFISIVANRLPEHQRARARTLGLGGALIMRVGLLLSITWVIGLTNPLFNALDHDWSWRDLILIGGGLFLLIKGTHEIHNAVEVTELRAGKAAAPATLLAAVSQIMVLDVIFSLDSVITAVGMVDELSVMIAAIVIAIVVMLWAAEGIATFIHQHPTLKMLALSFLLLIGTALVADGLHFHIPRGYIYFAVAFAIGVESLNLIAANRRKRLTAENDHQGD